MTKQSSTISLMIASDAVPGVIASKMVPRIFFFDVFKNLVSIVEVGSIREKEVGEQETGTIRFGHVGCVIMSLVS